MKKFIYSNIVLSTLLLSVGFIAALLLFGFLAFGTNDGLPPRTGELAGFTGAQIILSIIIIYLMMKLDVFSRDDFKLKGLGKGILLGWVGIVVAITASVGLITLLPPNSFIVPNIPHLLVVTLHPFVGTGLFEEVLFRGLVLKLLLCVMGDSKRGVIKACMISSALFGIVHISNAFFGAGILPTIAQVIMATAAGIFFAAIYLRTKNLLAPILLHGFINFCSQIYHAIVSRDVFVQLMYEQGEMTDIAFAGMMLFATLPYLIAGLILLRKVKPEPSSE